MRKRDLERRVLRLTNEFREGSSCARAELEAAKYQLRQIISDETRGYLLRARVAFLRNVSPICFCNRNLQRKSFILGSGEMPR